MLWWNERHSPESVAQSDVGGETLPAGESQLRLSVEATDRRPVWSRQCLPFQGSHLIDGSCHVLNRSIFLPPLRMLRVDCKQTCCWVTVYQPPSVAPATSCQPWSAGGNLFSFFNFLSFKTHVGISILLAESGWLMVKARLSNVCCIHDCHEQGTAVNIT